MRHERNLGIAAAYNTFVREGRGELIAMLGDDDVCLPDRLRRQVALFDRYPDTGVVHGDATVIDAQGHVTGPWNSADFTPAALMQSFLRSHNHLVDPTRMVHRRVYEAVGGYDDAYPLANDFDFWLRAAAALPLPPLPRRPAREGAPPRQQHLRRDCPRARDRRRRRGRCRRRSIATRCASWCPSSTGRCSTRREGERQALLRLADAIRHAAAAAPRAGRPPARPRTGPAGAQRRVPAVARGVGGW